MLSLLYGLGIVAGTIAFILPGIWLYIAWALAMPALLVEGLRGRKALGRSYGLVKGRWWRTFGVIAFGFIIVGVFSGIVQAVFLVGIVFEPDNDALILILSALSGIVGLVIGTPFQAALLTVVYFDLRVRKEGFDLELLAQGIGGNVPAVPVTSGPSPLCRATRRAGPGATRRGPRRRGRRIRRGPRHRGPRTRRGPRRRSPIRRPTTTSRPGCPGCRTGEAARGVAGVRAGVRGLPRRRARRGGDGRAAARARRRRAAGSGGARAPAGGRRRRRAARRDR